MTIKFCLSKKNQIISKTIKIISEQHKNHFINFCQWDYSKLEKECIKFSYHKMKISLKKKYKYQEYIGINKDTNFSHFGKISKGCVFSRVEGFDKKSSELQRIKIYAKDEFGQEKFTEAVVKVKDKAAPVQTDEKELETVQ